MLAPLNQASPVNLGCECGNVRCRETGALIGVKSKVVNVYNMYLQVLNKHVCLSTDKRAHTHTRARARNVRLEKPLTTRVNKSEEKKFTYRDHSTVCKQLSRNHDFVGRLRPSAALWRINGRAARPGLKRNVSGGRRSRYVSLLARKLPLGSTAP